MKQTFEITVEHWRRVQVDNPNGSRSWHVENLPNTQELVEVEIDVAGLVKEYGPKAVRNKNGRSRFAGGLIQFRNVSKLRKMRP